MVANCSWVIFFFLRSSFSILFISVGNV
jgi:hypothetical protein